MSDSPLQFFELDDAVTVWDAVTAGAQAVPSTPGSGAAAGDFSHKEAELLISTPDAGPVTITDLRLYWEVGGQIYDLGAANGGDPITVTQAVGYSEPLNDVGGGSYYYASGTTAGGRVTLRIVPRKGKG